MRYRKLTPEGDYTFGKRDANFYVNQPEAVAQAVQTRLRLILGEWFLDTSAGVPYKTKVLGMGTTGTYDSVIQGTILGTPGVKTLISYSSQLDRGTRKVTVSTTIDTIYGQTTIQQVL